MDIWRVCRWALRVKAGTTVALLLLLFALTLLWLITRSGVCRTDRASPGDDLHKEPLCRNELSPYIKTSTENRTVQGQREWFKDALVWGKRRESRVSLTIGVPCILRPGKGQYVVKTLRSLIRHSSDEQRKQIVIVLFLADADEQSRNSIGQFIYTKFRQHVDSGLLVFIKAPATFYPEFTNLRITYKDPLSKVRWRSKQNFDFAFMMLYSQSLSDFYLQLEDDVITVPNYFQSIQNFVALNNQKGHWVCLEFCSLGFIGKLYHSYDLEKLSQMLMLFYNEQPNDVTFLRFNEIMFQPKRLILKPTIFDHRGVRSSLKLKINSLTDLFFKGDPGDTEDEDWEIQPKKVANNFPPAKLSTTLKQYETYTPDKFYFGQEEIFWCQQPKKGDTFIIVFNTPQHLSNISVITGHENFQDDVLSNGALEVGRSASSSSDQLYCSDIILSKDFQKGQVVLDSLPRDLAIACVKIVVKEKQTNWLIISKLVIKST